MPKNLRALMGLAAFEGLAPEMKTFLQALECRLAVRSFGAGLDDPIQAELNEFLEGGFSLGRHDFRAVQESLGQINGRLHRQ